MAVYKTILGAGLLASVLGIGLAGGVSASASHQAQTPGANGANPKLERVIGSVSSVSSSGLVLTTPKKTINVTTGANTWVLIQTNNKCAEGSLSDIKTGARVEVAGISTTVTNTIAARVIAEGRCARQVEGKSNGKAVAKVASHVGEGTIKTITGSTLTVTGAKGNDFTVDTTADTVVLNNGFGTVSSLKVGDKVQVLGSPEKKAAGAAKGTARTLSAYAIHSEAAGTNILAGRTQSVNGNTVTLQTRKAKDGVSVSLGANTAYKTLTITSGKAALTAATQADVKADSRLIVEAKVSADGKSATAGAVIILPAAKAKTIHP